MKKRIEIINPTTEEISFFDFHSSEEILQKIQNSKNAQSLWKSTPIEVRKQVLINVAKVLIDEKASFAKTIHDEMGKSIPEAISEIEKCANCAVYYSENGAEFIKDEFIKTEASKSYIKFEPLGIVFAIMPWNFPFWQVFRCVLPAIFAGNSVLLKHASNVSGCALLIEKIFEEANTPEFLFQTLLISGEEALELIAHKNISAVSFTGSAIVGKKIAAQSGKNLKKAVLELGGSDPFLVLSDANIEKAAKAAAYSRLINAGQSCIAAKRFIIVKSVADKFIPLLIEEMKKMTLAPLARTDLRQELHRQVLKSISEGAVLLTGGKIPEGKGFFYPPTVLTNVSTQNTAFNEELFGPVAAITIVNSNEEAVDLANQSIYGLGATIFSENKFFAEKLAQKIEAGSCFINTFMRSDPRLPFGGIKESGMGRELGSYGIREFTNIKTVYIE